MKNKKLIVGLAAGAAALGVAAIILNKRRKANQFSAQAEEAKSNFKKKLNELQRKAQKEYKNSAAETKDTVNAAADRANDWVSKAHA
jgi:mannitol-specific phosphotransferase system IIBC component